MVNSPQKYLGLGGSREAVTADAIVVEDFYRRLTYGLVEQGARRGLRDIQYRSHLRDGCLAETGPAHQTHFCAAVWVPRGQSGMVRGDRPAGRGMAAGLVGANRPAAVQPEGSGREQAGEDRHEQETDPHLPTSGTIPSRRCRRCHPQQDTCRIEGPDPTQLTYGPQGHAGFTLRCHADPGTPDRHVLPWGVVLAQAKAGVERPCPGTVNGPVS